MTEHKVTVLDIQSTKEGILIKCEMNWDDLADPFPAPLAPGNLYVNENNRASVAELHRLVARSGRNVTFERFDLYDQKCPVVGETYCYQGWWMPEFMDAVMDEAASWELRDYPDNCDHDHLLFSYDTIAAYAHITRGYFNTDYGWATIPDWEAYIRDDIYQLRQYRAENAIPLR
jgi:hypothetical protein